MNADPFQVWGKPSKSILDDLSADNQRALRRYVERTAKKVYRLAYDLGSGRLEELRTERDDLRRVVESMKAALAELSKRR